MSWLNAAVASSWFEKALPRHVAPRTSALLCGLASVHSAGVVVVRDAASSAVVVVLVALALLSVVMRASLAAMAIRSS